MPPTLLHVQGLSLDVVLPQGVSTLLPNLHKLVLHDCTLTPAARTTVLDTACGRLRAVEIEALSVQAPQRQATSSAAGAPAQLPPGLQQLATAQLRQLARLPSLSSIDLRDASCPTLFLVTLGTQLTSLWVHESYRRCEPGTNTPTPVWRATLQHVGRCTRLRELNIPCATAEELALVAPGLQQLRMLTLDSNPAAEVDGDAVMEALLGLPHLTSLQWGNFAFHTFKRWHNDSVCRWERLTLSVVSPHQLARLPLHSLKQPVEWWCLLVCGNVPLRDVRAAVANVTRRCAAGFRWVPLRATEPPQLWLRDAAGRGVDVPAVLRALQPLFTLHASFVVSDVKSHVEVIKVLGEVLPRTCICLVLAQGSASREALEQVARSLPWVRRLDLREQQVAPADVVECVRAVRRLNGESAGGQGLVRLEEVVVERPPCPEDMSEATHRRAWEEALREVWEVRGGVALRVAW